MSSNLAQIFVANPITSIANGDLLYVVSGGTTDAAISGASLKALFAPATGLAMTRVDDTNVTLTLGGTPSTSLINAVSLTLGWTGQLGLTRGGTAASLTASNGGIVYSTSSALAILSGTATAGQIILSGANAAPNWSTATYPATAGTSGNVLTSDGTNWTSSAPTSSGLSQQQVMAINSVGV